MEGGSGGGEKKSSSRRPRFSRFPILQGLVIMHIYPGDLRACMNAYIHAEKTLCVQTQRYKPCS